LKPDENTLLTKEAQNSDPIPLTERLSKRTLNIIRAVVLVAVIALTVVLVINRDRIQGLQAYGYPGIFLLSALSYATVLFPVPGVMFTSAMGAVFNPFWVAVAAGTGAAVGELSGYMVGFSGQAVVENSTVYERVVQWMQRYGDITILVLATIPNPFFDVVGMLAGVLKMALWKFLLYCVIGNIIKMLMFAFAGDWLVRTLAGLF
jgi:uncharacterized membrane protein YdjX (TVP38/TMEM64 family)